MAMPNTAFAVHLSGGDWRAVAPVATATVWAGHRGGPVGVERDGPATAVDGDEVVEGAEQYQVAELGEAAEAARVQVMDLAAARRDIAAWGRAVPVPVDDGAAEVGRVGLGAGAGVQWQADGSGGARQVPGAE